MARYTQMQENDIQGIANNYGLAVLEFEPIEGGAGNSSYLLRAQQDTYVLTVFEEKTFSDATRMGQLLLLLAEHKFPTTRPLVPDKGCIITMHRDKPVMVKVYIAGQVYRDLDQTMLRQVGAAMARLHQIPVPDSLLDEQPYGVRHFSRTTSHNIDLEYEAWAAERLAHLEQHIPPGLPRGLIHCDVFYDNVLFVGKELKAIIDFEDAICFYKGFDLGLGFVGLCRDGSTVALDKARALVNGYQQVRILEEREKETLQLFVEYAATTISCWRFWKYNIESPSVEKADKHWQMVRCAQEIEKIPKARFMQAIFS
jgi:homoserine kinase type II